VSAGDFEAAALPDGDGVAVDDVAVVVVVGEGGVGEAAGVDVVGVVGGVVAGAEDLGEFVGGEAAGVEAEAEFVAEVLDAGAPAAGPFAEGRVVVDAVELAGEVAELAGDVVDVALEGGEEFGEAGADDVAGGLVAGEFGEEPIVFAVGAADGARGDVGVGADLLEGVVVAAVAEGLEDVGFAVGWGGRGGGCRW
jgi:hypothetical protein